VIGRARGLVEVVRGFCSYDAEVDTSAMDVTVGAEAVLAALRAPRSL
jgi:hypothetical protein